MGTISLNLVTHQRKLLSMLPSESQDGFDENGCLPLHRAAIAHDRKEIRRLLEGGVDVNARDASQCTALIYGVHYLETVDLLLSYGADPNLQSNCGNTPLHPACIIGQREVVMRLLQAGAKLDICNYSDMTPAETAIHWRHHELATLMSAYVVALQAQKAVEDETPNASSNLRPL